MRNTEKKFRLAGRCQRCGKSKTVTDAETGEMVCGACGLVFSERIENTGPEWRSFSNDDTNKSRIGDKTTLTKHDMGLATTISPVNKDATGKVLSNSMKMTIGRLRIWDSRSQHKPIDRNLKDAFSELSKMKDKLAIPDAVIEKAAYNYRKALEKNLVRGRSISSMIAASLYAACRDAETPRTLKEVAEVANIKKGELAACYRKLVNELDFRIPMIDPIQCITRIANKAGFSEKSKRNAINILRKAEQKKISAGKNPMSLAATVLYLAGIENGGDSSQREIAMAANITEVTIRNRIKEFRLLGLYKSL